VVRVLLSRRYQGLVAKEDPNELLLRAVAGLVDRLALHQATTQVADAPRSGLLNEEAVGHEAVALSMRMR
jgi:hypothetical protein